MNTNPNSFHSISVDEQINNLLTLHPRTDPAPMLDSDHFKKTLESELGEGLLILPNFFPHIDYIGECGNMAWHRGIGNLHRYKNEPEIYRKAFFGSSTAPISLVGMQTAAQKQGDGDFFAIRIQTGANHKGRSALAANRIMSAQSPVSEYPLPIMAAVHALWFDENRIPSADNQFILAAGSIYIDNYDKDFGLARVPKVTCTVNDDGSRVYSIVLHQAETNDRFAGAASFFPIE